jgi:hypothetical protein
MTIRNPRVNNQLSTLRYLPAEAGRRKKWQEQALRTVFHELGATSGAGSVARWVEDLEELGVD